MTVTRQSARLGGDESLTGSARRVARRVSDADDGWLDVALCGDRATDSWHRAGLQKRSGRGMKGVVLLVSMPLCACATSSVPDSRYGFEWWDAAEALERGQGAAALTFYQREAADLERRGRLLEASRAYGAAAFIGHRLGSPQATISAGLKALGLLERGRHRPEEFGSGYLALYTALGHAYGQVGDHDEQVRYYQRGLAAAGNDLFWSAVFTRALAIVSNGRGEYQQGLTYGRAALQSFQTVLGSTQDPTRRHQLRQDIAYTLLYVGRSQRGLGDLVGAEASYREALKIAKWLGSKQPQAAAVAGLAWVDLATGRYAEAVTRFEESIGSAERLQERGALAWRLAGFGQAYYRQRRYAEASRAFALSVDVVESIRGSLQELSLRSSHAELMQSIYGGAIESAVALGRSEEAFGYSERARARAFLDLLGNETRLSKGRTQALLREEMELREQLNRARAAARAAVDREMSQELRHQIDSAEAAYRSFLDRVRKESPEQASLMSVEPIGLVEVQGLLDTETTLLEYFVTERGALLWVVTRGGAQVLELASGESALAGAVKELRDAIAGHLRPDQVERPATALYETLLSQARPHLRGSNKLIIVPHGVLHYLPWAAVRSPEGKWLVEEYTLVTLPSASVLKYLDQKGRDAGGRVLAIGNPDLGPALELRYAEREARAVGARYPGATVLVRDAATEHSMKALAPEAVVLHLAVHGRLDERDPLSSALLLVPGGGDDGKLNVREVFALDLHAKLVVLSACETGLGSLSKGDELVGLQRAFLYAGTPAVVTTLWQVDDRASYELMRAFYHRLDELGPAGALRAAQRGLMLDTPHPYFWAGFSVTGRPE